MSALLRVDDVTHDFGGEPVLNHVSLKADPGEIVVIMGSSGGGKTTLLKCIAGLLRPKQGDITVDGVSVVREPEQARLKLGLVFQYAALFDSLNVSENILFGLRRQRKVAAAEGKELVRHLLDEVGLGSVEKQLPDQLSGGMRKRVGLARALAMSPGLLLYDEPTSGLDPVTAYAIDQLIVETRDHSGATSVVVSHDVSSVLRVADRIAFLHQGEVHFWGTRVEFQASREEFVRELVDKAKAETLV